MKKLVLLCAVALAGCSSSSTQGLNSIVPNLHLKTPEGAGFSPYYVSEYRARAARGEPGTAPQHEPVYRENGVESARGYRVAERPFREVFTDGSETGAEAAAKNGAGTGAEEITVGSTPVRVSLLRVDGQRYVVFGGYGRGFGRSLSESQVVTLERAVPQLTGGCKASSTSSRFGSGDRVSKLVVPITCA